MLPARAPSAASATPVALPGAIRGGTVFHRDQLTCRWIDMRWLREAVDRACRNSAYGVVT